MWFLGFKKQNQLAIPFCFVWFNTLSLHYHYLMVMYSSNLLSFSFHTFNYTTPKFGNKVQQIEAWGTELNETKEEKLEFGDNGGPLNRSLLSFFTSYVSIFFSSSISVFYFILSFFYWYNLKRSKPSCQLSWWMIVGSC